MELKLYEISDKYAEIMHEIDNLEDDILDPRSSYQNILDSIEDDFKAKALCVAAFTKNLEAEHEAIDAHIETMQKRKKAIENKIDWLKYYLMHNMQQLGLRDIKNAFINIYIQKSNPSVKCNQEELSDEYLITKTEVKPNKNKIRDDLIQGVFIEGAELIQSEHVRIK